MTDLGLTDEDLITAVADGDHAALLRLYDRHGRTAYGLAYRILGEAGAAEDAVQDAFLRVWRRASTFDPVRGAGRSWLLTIEQRCAIKLLRRGASAPPIDAGLDEIAERQGVLDGWSDVAGLLAQDRVRSAVATLPSDQQRAIEMAYFGGLTYREIAERDDLPLGTVKGQLRLGLRRLYGLVLESVACQADGERRSGCTHRTGGSSATGDQCCSHGGRDKPDCRDRSHRSR